MSSIKNCNVAVIGGAGFIGSHMVNHLIEDRGCNVLVLDNLITGSKKHVNSNATFEWCDIRDDEKELAATFKHHGIQYVFNYAAEPYIPECFERPMHFFDINARAVLQVLNACQRSNVKGVLQMSSAEIYGDMAGKIKETDPISPHSTYGVSKVAADGLVQVRWKEAAVPAIALRQFNCIGERETHDYVVPEIITQLCNPKSWGDLIGKVYLGNNTVRDFMYAGDAVRMAVELLESERYGEVFNMGSETGVRIYDLAKTIAKLCGYSDCHIAVDGARMRPWDIEHLQSDNSKLYATIKARPEVSLVDALQRTIDYYKNNKFNWGW